MGLLKLYIRIRDGTIKVVLGIGPLKLYVRISDWTIKVVYKD